MNPMMRTLLGELTQVRGHSILVLPTGVELPDRPSDSELSLWKGRCRMSSAFGRRAERGRLCPGNARLSLAIVKEGCPLSWVGSQQVEME